MNLVRTSKKMDRKCKSGDWKHKKEPVKNENYSNWNEEYITEYLQQIKQILNSDLGERIVQNTQSGQQKVKEF